MTYAQLEGLIKNMTSSQREQEVTVYFVPPGEYIWVSDVVEKVDEDTNFKQMCLIVEN